MRGAKMWELTDQHGVYKMLRLAGRTKTFSCCLQTIGHQTTKLQKKRLMSICWYNQSY